MPLEQSTNRPSALATRARIGALIAALMALSACCPDTKSDAPADSASSLPAEAQALIDGLDMQPIPQEGAWFYQTYKSEDILDGSIAARYPTPRSAYTAIYALMTAEGFSAMHRLKTDELWHFYSGSPAEIILLHPDGSGEIHVLGDDVAAGQRPQVMAPAGVWMGARPLGDPATAFTFFGTTMTPGFEYDDYEHGDRDTLVAAYPDFADMIVALTRVETLDPSAEHGSNAEETPTPEESISMDTAPAPLVLTEKIGRNSTPAIESYSVAHIVLQPGATSPLSHLKTADEAAIIISGTGSVRVGDEIIPVEAGSVVHMPPMVPHQVIAETRLEAYLVVTPAWQPEEMVMDE